MIDSANPKTLGPINEIETVMRAGLHLIEKEEIPAQLTKLICVLGLGEEVINLLDRTAEDFPEAYEEAIEIFRNEWT